MTTPATLIRDLTDDEARRALVCKWGAVADDEIPAWVAEMDYALAPPVASALQEAVAIGMTGYPLFKPGGRLGEALAGFADRHFGWAVDPEMVLPVSDVTAGVRLALDVLSDPRPGRAAHAGVRPAAGGRRGHRPGAGPGARWTPMPRTPHWTSTASTGRSPPAPAPCSSPSRRTRSAGSTGATSSRVCATSSRGTAPGSSATRSTRPLVMPGHEHVPYLSIPGTAEHAVTVLAASKAFNTAGLRCAQIVTADPTTHQPG